MNKTDQKKLGLAIADSLHYRLTWLDRSSYLPYWAEEIATGLLRVIEAELPPAIEDAFVSYTKQGDIKSARKIQQLEAKNKELTEKVAAYEKFIKKAVSKYES